MLLNIRSNNSYTSYFLVLYTKTVLKNLAEKIQLRIKVELNVRYKRTMEQKIIYHFTCNFSTKITHVLDKSKYLLCRTLYSNLVFRTFLVQYSQYIDIKVSIVFSMVLFSMIDSLPLISFKLRRMGYPRSC